MEYMSSSCLGIILYLVLSINIGEPTTPNLHWYRIPSFDLPLDYVPQAAVFGYLNSTESYYIIGGWVPGYNEPAIIYRYNTKTHNKQWTKYPLRFTIPFDADNNQYLIHNNTFYIFNPFDPNNDNNFIRQGSVFTFNGTHINEYNATTTNAQYSVSFGCSVSNGTHAFVIGGQPAAHKFSSIVQLFHLENLQYVESSDLAPVPINTAHNACQYYAPTNTIYLFGGYYRSGCDGVMNSIYKYDIDNNMWSLLNATLSTQRAYFGSVMRSIKHGNIVADYIYLIGGQDSNCNPSNVVDIFEPQNEECYVSKQSRLVHGVESGSLFYSMNNPYGIMLIGGKNNSDVNTRAAFCTSKSNHGNWTFLGLNEWETIAISACLFIVLLVISVVFFVLKKREKNDAGVFNDPVLGIQQEGKKERTDFI